MDFNVAHLIPGRVRFRVNSAILRERQNNVISQALSSEDGVSIVKMNYRTGSILVYYDTNKTSDLIIGNILKNIDVDELPFRKGELEKSLGWSYIRYQIFRFLMPIPLRPYATLIGSVPFFVRAIKSLLKLEVNVNTLDASAIGASLLLKDFKSASTLMMLIKTGDYLEEWAKKRTTESLSDAMSLNIGNVWVKTDEGEVQISYNQIKTDDIVIIRAGTMIPVDGQVQSGEAMVNEASLTGEPLSVNKSKGNSVSAGTVIEEGELYIKVIHKGDDTRFQKIVNLIQDSENAKAKVEMNANALADKIVPYNFLIAGATYAISKNPRKASAALSVDYSCAMKLATPLSFLSTMREGLEKGIFFKGGSAIEALSSIDTIIFDKTGTLTKATPQVYKVIPYGGYSEKEVLKIAACLEEHFPHPVAKAVVKEALTQDVEHREEHSEIKYIVAHGVATEYKGMHTVIGSRHFVSDDEGVDITIAEADINFAANEGYSILYLAVNKELAGIILLQDPMREEAADVIAALKKVGINDIWMLTGDSQHAAQRIAKQLGIKNFKAEVLPNDKADVIKSLKQQGKIVAMVGDGMNDSPALSMANVGIAMKGGADIAMAVADITLNDPSLYTLVVAKMLADKAMNKIHNNNVSAIAINSVLMSLGIGGFISQSLSVWMHNLTTLGISLNSMRSLLPRNYDPVSSKDK